MQVLPDKFNSFFVNKISDIRSSLDSYDINNVFDDHVFDGKPLNVFSPVSTTYVRNIIMTSKKSFCELDSLPRDMFIHCIDILLPFITTIFNDSLSDGIFPNDFKDCLVTPLIKKSGLDCNILKNYRPVSNLSFISKVLERIVFKQIVNHLQENCLFDKLQSAYRSGHSTETALLKVVNDIVCDIDNGNVSFLTMLDLSAAFDTIDHKILFHRLSNTFGINDTVLNWFKSYLHGRYQRVKICDHYSSDVPVVYGIPQGSVLGPLIFLMYIFPISDVVNINDFSYHQYADDMQLYTSCKPDSVMQAADKITSTTSLINDWMSANKLKMNNDKTEIILCGTNPKRKLVNIDSIDIGDVNVALSSEVKDLGVMIDSGFSFNKHVSFLRRSCYYQIRRISNIRPFISVQSAKSLAVSLILSKLDYCNSLFFDMSDENFNALQLLQNHAARVVLKAKRDCSATALLKELHWLPVRQRVLYKIALIVFKCLHFTDFPSYLKDLVVLHKPSKFLRSGDKHLLQKPFKKLHFGNKCLHYSAPHVWNDLPLKIRATTCFTMFKRLLKTHFFRIAFN